MQFFHFGTGNQLIQQINSGYCMQYSDSVEQVFVSHDIITQENHQRYSAILSCTPNGATTALENFALTWGSVEIAGTTYWGFYCYLSSLYTQIAGPMACNLVVSNLTQVIVSQTFSIMVNASSSSTDWSESINQAQWKELMNYVSGLKIPNLGSINFVLGTAGSIIDTYYGSANAGAYYFTDSSGNSYLLAVGYSRTVTTQTLYYKLAGNSVFVGAQRTYDSGATTPEWSAWSQYTGYLPLTGGTMLGAVNFGYYASTWSNGTDTSTMAPGGLAFSQGAHLTQYERTHIYIDGNSLRFPALTDDETAATESYVDSAVAVETARAETAEQTNAAAIAQEITDRSSAVSAEALARENGDSATLASAQSYADSKVSSVYKPKGSVATYADLPSNPNTGDVYNVTAAYGTYPPNTNFVWTGSAWDSLGGSVDLSGYVPTSRTVNGHALTSDVTVTKQDILGTYGGTQVTDLNSIALSGFYTCYGTAAGAPKESSSWFVIHTNSNAGTSYAEQTAISFSDGSTFKRYKLSASVWSDWDRQMAVSDFCSSYNLYDYTRSLTNVRLFAGTGAEVAATGNFCSSFIRIKPSTSYLICVAAGSSDPSTICFYDSSKAFLSYSVALVSVSPPNASFVRFSSPISAVSSSMVVETANSHVPYFIPFRNHIMASAISDDLSENIVDSSLKTSKLSLAFSKNMFDKESAISGYFVSPSLGVLVPGSSYSTSAYIPVKENSYYSGIQSPWILNMRFVSCFTKTKEVIGSGFTNVATFLTPSGCAFIRVTVTTDALSTTQLIRGSTVPSAIDYSPYNLGIPKSSIIDDSPDSSSLHIFLPSEICVAVGRTIEIYDSQVVLENDKYHLNWTCAIGKNLKRKFSVTGTTALIGEYSLVLSVYDDSLNLVVSKTATLKIVAAETNPVSVLPLGDSITNGKYWLDETRSLSGDLVTFVGTLGTAPLNHEGRSGWTASQYVSSASVSGVTNPFYDPSVSHFSWSYYKTQTGKNPNAVLINLGTNGLSLDPSSAVASFKQLVDYIRTDDSSIPIYVSFIHFWGNQNGIGIQQSVDGFASQPGTMKFSQDVKVLLYNKALFDALSSYSNLHFVPIGECHDSENNFGDVQTLVNPRASVDQTVSMPVEGVHPQQQGYEQFADVIFSVLSKYVG